MMSALICKCTVFLLLTLKALSVALPESPIQHIYLHPDIFKDNYCNVAPKDVGAFKYFCIHDYLSSMVNQYTDIFADADSFSLENYFNNATSICKEYADIKTYQFISYQFLGNQGTANIPNTTILAIVYLLQEAGKSLQQIQYDNHQIYCPDYDEDIQTLVTNQIYAIESVFMTLYERHENDWSQNNNYPELFNSSRHIQYRNRRKSLCQQYLSPLTALIMAIL